MIDVFRKTFRLLSPGERRGIAVLVPLMIVAAGLEMVGVAAVPAFVALLADPGAWREYALLRPLGRVVEVSTDRRLVIWGSVALLVLFLVKNLYLGALNYLQARFVEGVRARLSVRLFEGYMFSPYLFHVQRNPADLLRNSTLEPRRVIDLALLPGLNLAREAFVIAALLGVFFLYEPEISLSVFFVMSLAAILFYRIVRARVTAAGEQEHHHSGRMVQAANQGLGAIKEAKVLRREAYFARAFANHATRVTEADRLVRYTQTLPRLFIESLAVIAVLAVAMIYVVRGDPVASALPMLALLAVVMVRMIPSFNQISSALTTLRYADTGIDAVFRECEEFTPDGRVDAEPEGGHPPAPEIVAEDVHYRYPGTASDTLSAIDLAIPGGSVAGLAGATGSGKTTLANLVLGLLEPTRGRITIAGRPPTARVGGPAGWIGYVPQDIFLADDTIRKNIALGLEESEIREGAVMRAVTTAHLEEFVESLPEGLDTFVGDRGVRLSGGQRQRIGIARALYTDPGVLVLDEATSALDNETERSVLEAIEWLRGNRTVVTIAHRLTTLRHCDELFFLEGGRVTARGTYEELLRDSPGFRRMAESGGERAEGAPTA